MTRIYTWVVALMREPWEWEPPERARAAEIGPEHQIVRHGAQRLASGALICPDCELPMILGEPVPSGAPLACSFCGAVHPGRVFVRVGVIDTPRNEVFLVARLPA